MRFLLGIILGSGLTLFLATALDAPTSPTVSGALTRLSGLWDDLINGTAEVVPLEAEPGDRTGAPEPAEPAMILPASAPTPPPVMIPITRPPQQPELRVAAAAATAAPEPSAVEAAAAAEVMKPVAPEAVTPATLPLLAVSSAEAAAVWTPFHSQMSAEGFAERLSRQLDHPFTVERHGPGAYQVVFESADPLEREALLARVQEVTGR